MIHIVTDSTAQLTASEIKQYHIHVVPLQVMFEGKTYKDQIDIDSEEFSRILATEKEFPTTSQPTMGDFVNTFQQIIDKDPEAKIISIHIGSKLSGTSSTAEVAAEQFKNEIAVIDSKSAIRGMDYLLIRAAQLAQQGTDFPVILKDLHKLEKHTHLYLFINNLDYLVKGGRASKATGFISSIIRLKPVITFENNELDFKYKCRGNKQLNKIKDRVVAEIIANPNIKDVGLPFVDDNTTSLAIADALHEARPDIHTTVNYVSPSLMFHAGPGGFAIVYNDQF